MQIVTFRMDKQQGSIHRELNPIFLDTIMKKYFKKNVHMYITESV